MASCGPSCDAWDPGRSARPSGERFFRPLRWGPDLPVADLLARLRAALVGRYTIERELGRGGMATVDLGRDLKHHRAVAIKGLRPALAEALCPQRLVRAIQNAGSLTQ